MKKGMMLAAMAALMIGITSQAKADPWRGRGHWHRPHVAVRVYAAVPRIIVPAAPVVVSRSYGYEGQHCAPKCNDGYNCYNNNCNNGYSGGCNSGCSSNANSNSGYYNNGSNGYNNYNNGYSNNGGGYNNYNNGYSQGSYYDNGYNGNYQNTYNGYRSQGSCH